ncbi:MAG: hypothetical protein FWE15_23735 [Actinomycetia bacterium]|nr:hypothetical protein [Actinomycetes bacterium]MCL2733020.1 hypothetical protein [Actinomycetes bacterium]
MSAARSGRGPARARRLGRRAWRLAMTYVLRPVGLTLVNFGYLWFPPPGPFPKEPSPAEPEQAASPLRAPLRDPAGPALYHPERLRPDIPLSEVERALQRQLWAVDDEYPGNPPLSGGRA